MVVLDKVDQSANSQSKALGTFLAVFAATLWGVSGTFAQFLFQQRGINPEWLVTIRLLIAGFVLLIFSAFRSPGEIVSVWKSPRDAAGVVIFGVFGMLAVQYTYFAAINASNAATATVLQYVGPTFIAVYSAARARRLPYAVEVLAIALSMAGTYFLVTHGNSNSLAISRSALAWGLASALALAIYSIQPVKLLKKFDAALVVGWGMVVGGLAFSLFYAPWNVPGIWDNDTALSVLFVVIFGTLAPFYAYLTAVNILGPTRTSLLACAEPLSATIVAVLWLHVTFGFFDWLGTILVLTTIVVLSLPARRSG